MKKRQHLCFNLIKVIFSHNEIKYCETTRKRKNISTLLSLLCSNPVSKTAKISFLQPLHKGSPKVAPLVHHSKTFAIMRVMPRVFCVTMFHLATLAPRCGKIKESPRLTWKFRSAQGFLLCRFFDCFQLLPNHLQRSYLTKSPCFATRALLPGMNQSYYKSS